MEKEKFYIFLDIDGVLWDFGHLINALNKQIPYKNTAVKYFKKESMDALNFLIENLQNVFDVELVITSTWRKNMKLVEKVLTKNKLAYNKPLQRTEITAHSIRGQEIEDFLKDKPNKENLVIIDDVTKDIFAFFPMKNIIKTNLTKALNKKQVENFFKYNNIKIFEKEQEMQQ